MFQNFTDKLLLVIIYSTGFRLLPHNEIFIANSLSKLATEHFDVLIVINTSRCFSFLFYNNLSGRTFDN